MACLLLCKLACWWRGDHTYAVKFRDNAKGYPVMGHECVDCLHWTRSPFIDQDGAA